MKCMINERKEIIPSSGEGEGVEGKVFRREKRVYVERNRREMKKKSR